MIRALLRFAIYRDSESAACVCIEIAQRMSERDLIQISQYLTALAQNKMRE